MGGMEDRSKEFWTDGDDGCLVNYLNTRVKNQCCDSYALFIITLVTLATFGYSSVIEQFSDRQDANSFLTIPESFQRFRRGSVLTKTICDFDSVEAWNEFKDGVEELPLPEEEIDELETCTHRCW